MRQCGRPRGGARLARRQGIGARHAERAASARKAARLGIATNPAFAGAYDFDAKADFAAIFPRFLAGLPDGGLIMCHPGFVDAALEDLDTLTNLREREFAFLQFGRLSRACSAEHGVALAQPAALEHDDLGADLHTL